MDAAYLKKNVMVALTEALTSMAVKIPDDSIEYIGKYLLVYVQRQKEQAEATAKLQNVENELSEYLAAQANVSRAADEKKAEKMSAQAKYRRFLDSLEYDFTTKQAALDAVCEFIEGNLDIPAAYIAVKKAAGESEVLNYVSAGPSQQSVKGRKLPKPAADEGDEAPDRQGVSFEAFKLPEVPEEEEPAEEPEEDAPVVEKVPPKAQPLIVENVMRDKRVKFLNGVGKLGAFAAIPFSYPSILHEEGCVLGTVEGTAEEGAELPPPDYEFNRKPTEFIIGVDTMGKYRTFKRPEIERIQEIGDKLVQFLTAIEAGIGERHKEFVKSDEFRALNSGVEGEFVAKLAEAEAAVLAKVGEEVAALQASAVAEAAAAAEAAGGEAEETAAGGVSELLRPAREAAAVLEQVWSPAVASACGGAFTSLSGYLLPPPAPVLNLFHAVGCLVGYAPAELQNVCGDPDWEAIQLNCLPTLAARLVAYKSDEARMGADKGNTLGSIKAFAEATGILDGGAYPPTFAFCGAALLPWLQKALTAREAAVALSAESGAALE